VYVNFEEPPPPLELEAEYVMLIVLPLDAVPELGVA
jgi:hypothetical protein